MEWLVHQVQPVNQENPVQLVLKEAMEFQDLLGLRESKGRRAKSELLESLVHQEKMESM